MDLYLVRHAIAFDADPARWPDDRERPLTSAGKKRFKQAARGVGALVSSVDVVLSSPLARAWQTAELLQAEAGWPRPVACDALEPMRAPADALQALQPFADVGAVALVGHEPHLHELASYLLTADTTHVQVEMRKGSVARFDLPEGLRPGSAILRWLLPPRVLRAVAP
jgi:phosphohistidine phosphatase